VVVLLLWIPLRQPPGLGTISNALGIGLSIDATLALLPDDLPLGVAIAMIPAGIAIVGLGSGFYLTSFLGPGPRDGLMTGVVSRTGGSVRLVRSAIEVVVVAVGFLLGGTVGLTTVLYALGIGPLVHALLPRLSVELPAAAPTAPAPEPSGR
jgi:uncharacterized membrane protein YczE